MMVMKHLFDRDVKHGNPNSVSKIYRMVELITCGLLLMNTETWYDMK